MNDSIYNVELQTSQFRGKINSVASSKFRLLILFEYYNELLNSGNEKIIEAYIPEFIQMYISLLNNFDPYCLNPSITQSLIEQTNKIDEYLPETEINNSLKESARRLQKELVQFKNVLNGKIPDELISNKLCFPLLKESNSELPALSTGILETVTIKVSKAKDENNFLLIPSEIKIDTRLQKQIETSWQKAIEIVQRYIKKIAGNHKVVIQFDKRVGFYRGNSLGAALTISFIEELLDYYNSPVIIKTGEGIALTGGMEKDGSLIPTSKEVIEKKVENVFFSPIQTFVVPEEDLPFAEEKLKTFKQEFPQRQLNLIGIKTFDDLLDSRKLVDIRKQKLIVRSGKFVKKNWVSLVFIFLFSVLLSYLLSVDLDTNPSYISINKEIAEIKNKSGKVLWTKKISNKWNATSGVNNLAMVVDIDNDGRNEVLVSREIPDKNDIKKIQGRVVCFESNGEFIWNYLFQDSVRTDIPHSRIYASRIIDTATYKSKKVIYLYAQNKPLYPSAIYRVDALTGERLEGTFWHAGMIETPFIGDFNGDDEQEIVAIAVNNGFERTVVFSIYTKELDGQGPSTKPYIFKNIKKAHLNKYILLPKSDLTGYYSMRYNPPFPPDSKFNWSVNEFQFSVKEGRKGEKLLYSFDGNLQLKLIDFNDIFQFMRNSLVKKKILSPPLTNTLEYRNLLERQMRFWDGEGFVKR